MNNTSGIQCVGIIMDGNRRWAKERGLPKLEGHRAGSEKLKDTVHFVQSHGIAHLVVYAFSTENWNRESSEVLYLMELFRELVKKEMKELGEEGARIRFIGQRERFSPELQQIMLEREKETELNDAITLWIALSYGGRAEVIAAAKAAAAAGEITEETLSNNLWTAGMPEPDIIIRTGGEKRLSNFLAWQSVYSELFFTDSFWPAFTKEEFDTILLEFAARERRHGK